MSKALDFLGFLGRKIALCPELWILGFTSLFLFSCVFQVEPWWTIYLRLKRFVGAVFNIFVGGKKSNVDDEVASKSNTVADVEDDGRSWSMRKGSVAVYALQGRRPKMEDRFSILLENEHTGTTLCGIFDGHGGEFAADFVEKTLFKSIMVRILKSALSGADADFGLILRDSILSLDEQLLSIAKITAGPTGGTTCLVSLIRGETLHVANVGDSRSVVCDGSGEAIALTVDHKPQQLSERKRIKAAGGFISFHGVWRVGGVLATSRALGDLNLKQKNLIVADPDVRSFALGELNPKFMIMATDGLWDCISNQDAVDFIKQRLDEPQFGARSLVRHVYKQGAIDNITVLIINFDDLKSVKIAAASSDDISAAETEETMEEEKKRNQQSINVEKQTGIQQRNVDQQSQVKNVELQNSFLQPKNGDQQKGIPRQRSFQQPSVKRVDSMKRKK